MSDLRLENERFKVEETWIYAGPWKSAFGATKRKGREECVRTMLKLSGSFRKIENLEGQRSQESA